MGYYRCAALIFKRICYEGKLIMKKGGHYLEKKMSNQLVWVKRVIFVLILALLVVALTAGFVYSKMSKIKKAQDAPNQLTNDMLAGLLAEDPTGSYADDFETEPMDTTVPKETSPDYGKTGKVINVLLIGQDAREGEESKNADTVILVTINKETKKITMTSFLRDSYVSLNGLEDVNGSLHYGATKLTLVYAMGYMYGGDLGAMHLMDRAIEKNFGPIVDHNIEVSMDAFDACINALGGVAINLDEDEAKYMNNYFKDYDDRVYEAGENLLDGWAAEVYVRTRHANYGDNDFNRTDRQRAVVAQVLEKVKNKSLLEINKLVDSLLPFVLTDMSNADMTNYILEILPLLPEMTLDSIQCPNEEMDRWGEVRDIFGDGLEQSILNFDSNKAKAILIPITECD